MDEKIVSALIGGIAGATLSLVSSYIIMRLKNRHELKLWNSDFAISYAKLLAENPLAAAHLARQFSIGLIIVRDEDNKTESKHFLPYQCKVSVGRSKDNDIVLSQADKTVSRHHGIFFYKGEKMLFQELSPTNTSRKNGEKINKICSLNSGDTIIIGNTLLEFEELK